MLSYKISWGCTFRIVIGIMMLAIFLAGGAGANKSDEILEGNIAWNNSSSSNAITAPIPISAPFLLMANPTTAVVNIPINVTFTVIYNSTPAGGATVILGGNATGIGSTDSNGKVFINVKATGAGPITATVTKTGYSNTTYPAILTATMPVTPPVNVTFAVRMIEKEFLLPGESTNITVDISSNMSQSLALHEIIPAGWNMARISDDADVFKNSTSESIWFNVKPGINKTVIYRLTAPDNASMGTYHINGTIRSARGVIVVQGGNTIILNLMPPQPYMADATRQIEKESLGPGESTNITIRISGNMNKALALQELIPAGWNLTRISDDADGFKSSTNEWIWFNVSPGVNKTVIYTITKPTDAANETYYINGTISTSNGMISIVGGNNMITLDISAYYRRLGNDPGKVETKDVLKAMDDMRSAKAPAGFARPITILEVSALINEWIVG